MQICIEPSYNKKGSNPTGAVLLFWDTNMADVITEYERSCGSSPNTKSQLVRYPNREIVVNNDKQ